eukprot:6459450-Amphidinium_carterae.1
MCELLSGGLLGVLLPPITPQELNAVSSPSKENEQIAEVMVLRGRRVIHVGAQSLPQLCIVHKRVCVCAHKCKCGDFCVNNCTCLQNLSATALVWRKRAVHCSEVKQ